MCDLAPLGCDLAHANSAYPHMPMCDLALFACQHLDDDCPLAIPEDVYQARFGISL
jgi:hypothetical protein